MLVIAQDEAERIAAAVRSVLDFAAEVIVVDGGSTDDTMRICRELGCRVVENPWPGYAAQRRVAVEQASSEWVLFLDADEVVTEALARSIVAVTQSAPSLSAFTLVRVGDFFGRWVGTDDQLRLCRRDCAYIPDVLVHEHLEVPAAEVGTLDGALLHYGFRSVNDHIQRFSRYTDLEARAALAGGRRFRASRLLLRPPAHFLLEYLGRGLWRRGVPGMTVALFWSVYDIMVEAKLYELQWRATVPASDPPHEPPRP